MERNQAQILAYEARIPEATVVNCVVLQLIYGIQSFSNKKDTPYANKTVLRKDISRTQKFKSFRIEEIIFHNVKGRKERVCL